MQTEKKLTGYPSIDRPQERFYRIEPVREIETEQTIYELVFNSNKNNMTAPAIEYMGVTWSFEKLKEKGYVCSYRKVMEKTGVGRPKRPFYVLEVM